MRPENVLSEEGIRERFRFSRVRHHDDEDQQQPLQTALPIPHSGNLNYNTHPYQDCTLPNPYPSSNLPLPYPGSTHAHPGSTLSYPYPSHMMMPHPHPHQFPAPSPIPLVPAPASPPPCYIRVSVIQKAPQPFKVETPSPVNSESMEQQSDTEITNSSSDSDTSRDSDILVHKRAEDFCAVANSSPGFETEHGLSNPTQDEYDFLILNYVHKKFKRTIEDTGAIDDNESSRDEEDVRAESIIGDMGDSMDQDIDVSELQSLMYQLAPKLEDLETERTLMVDMKNSFDSCWRSINFGEKAWSSYIDFCAGKAAMDPRMWSFAFFQVR